VISCTFPQLSAVDPRSEDDGGGGGSDGGPSSDGATSDAEPRPLNLELLAGGIGGPGNADGAGVEARFNLPEGVVVDNVGNVYVADTYNNVIRRITAAGVVTTLAGTAGSIFAKGVAVDNSGNIYFSAMQTIQKITTAGIKTTLAGGSQGSADGTGAAARFSNPSGVTVDAAGNVYVADRDNDTIRKIDAAGVVTTLAGTAGQTGSTDGTGVAARFNHPSGVTIDSAGTIYVGDSGNNTIRKITAAGVVTTLAGTPGSGGSIDGTGAAARFRYPWGVAVDSAGNIYVADYSNHTVRKVTAAGVVTTLAGTASSPAGRDDLGAAARFHYPTGVAVDSAGNVYVADQFNHTIRKVTGAGVVTTLAGITGTSGSTDGTGAAARFLSLNGMAVDNANNIYVTDDDNHTIRKITAAGDVTTLAGTAGQSGSTDGTGAAARFFSPHGMAVDSAGNLYVADQTNETIRKITAAGVVTTLAGAPGISGSTDGTGAAARFYRPDGLAIDNAGNLYVADNYNHTIRKVTAAGVVTTLAGAPGISGSTDGTGAAARFYLPTGVAVDSAGNLYVTDSNNHTVRKVTPAGVVTTLAGIAGSYGSTDGASGVARLFSPQGVALDTSGNVYISDRYSTVRKITASGTVTTMAGIPITQGILLGVMPRFAFPRGLAIIGDSIAIADSGATLLLHHGAQ